MFCIIPFKTDDTRIILSITIKHNFIFIKQVKFSELTLDMFRMLQTLEREPQEDLAQIYDASPAPGRVPFVSFLLKNEEFRLQRLRFDSRLQIGGPKQSKNENEVEKFFMPFTIEIQTLHNLISVVRIVKCRLCQTNNSVHIKELAEFLQAYHNLAYVQSCVFLACVFLA